MKKVILSLVAVSVALSSCNSGSTHSESTKDQQSKNQVDNQDKVDSTETVKSIYDNSSTTIGFGAFKTSAKKEVKGWFKSFEVTGISESKDVAEIFKNVSISIDVASLDTKDEGRNATLLSEFFNKTSSNELIKGKVISFNTDSAVAILQIDFNGVEKELEFNYMLDGDTLSMQSVLGLGDVNGLEALASLHTACEALHKGDDGVSKTWDDVNIYITTILNR